MTETEVEFDANERDSWRALAEYRSSICPQCKNLRAICSDPEGVAGEGYYPQLDVCWVTASRDVASRRWHKKHEKASPDSAGYLPTDGAALWSSPLDLSPDDDFLG